MKCPIHRSCRCPILDFEDDEAPTLFGHRTLVGPAIEPRAPAPPRKRTRLRSVERKDIPAEWGLPEVTVEW